MALKRLRLAPTLALPLDFVTKTAAILAQRRKGKTYLASVIAEELVAAKQPFVALDPTGAWWGLRASADGRAEGLPVVVLGGQHGDVPLERTGGKLIADLVVDEPGYYVIDFSLFESGEAERQFAVDFGERLYRAKGQPGRDFPLHLFVDEADRFIPQQIRKGSQETSARLLGAFEAIVRRGGLRGLGTTLISQRAAVVNKNVLEMLDILFALRTVGPNDREAIEGYIEAHGTAEEREALMGSIASLEIGEAWVWEPGAEPPLFQRVRIRRRRTFNSSATPKPGEKRVEPRRLAAVDLAALQTRMAATIEKAKADDPRELRRQIAELQQASASIQIIAPADKIYRPPKETPILTDADRALLGRIDESLAILRKGEIGVEFDTFVAALQKGVNATVGAAQRAVVAAVDTKRFQEIARKLTLAAERPPIPSQPAAHTVSQARPLFRRDAFALVAQPLADSPEARPGLQHPGARKILTAIAQHAEGVTREQLSVLTGYRKTTRDTYVYKLQAQGLIATNGGGTLVATAAGVGALGAGFAPLPTGDALRAYWLERLPPGERAILEVVLAGHPKAVSREIISDATQYKKTSRDTYLQKLAARRLVTTDRDGVRASAELFA